MQARLSFTDCVAAASQAARRLEDDGVLSLAIPLETAGAGRGPDPLALLPWLADPDPLDPGFRFLWDGAPGLSLAAAGRCHSLVLSGPRRFELAQRFTSLSLGRLTTAPASGPALARPRVLLAFSFFDAPSPDGPGAIPGLEAVLPTWQLSRQGRHGWLRLQRPLGAGQTVRSLVEELWDRARQLELAWGAAGQALLGPAPAPQLLGQADWRPGYRQAVARALELVDTEALRKLVLAVRQELVLERPLDPLPLLAQLREQQPGSCRFLWQGSDGGILLGASPERLLTVRQGQLRSDALAGTAALGAAAEGLTASPKDRHEHELVVEAITAVLQQQGLSPRRPRHPRLARHGQLVHLHTPITAALGDRHPLAVAEALHPTPAVAGLPRREAMGWLRHLEPFSRGRYAAPIGWIDSEGETELRVAIRSGVLRHDRLELTAGAGLVKGSEPERELQEIALKLGVLQQQFTGPRLRQPLA